MGRLVLVRHGESRWNLHNRFTGWVDVPLSEKGIKEAERCALHCKRYEYAAAFTSNLTRAQATLLIILSQQERTGIFQHDPHTGDAQWIHHSNRYGGSDIPIFSSAALNERYYGALQGMNKETAEKKYGKTQVRAWRRGYADKPPRGESLKAAHARMHPYFVRTILPRVRRGENIIVTAHGNTLRAAIKHLELISDVDISHVDLPDATPLIYEFRRGRFVRTEGQYRLDRPLR